MSVRIFHNYKGTTFDASKLPKAPQSTDTAYTVVDLAHSYILSFILFYEPNIQAKLLNQTPLPWNEAVAIIINGRREKEALQRCLYESGYLPTEFDAHAKIPTSSEELQQQTV